MFTEAVAPPTSRKGEGFPVPGGDDGWHGFLTPARECSEGVRSFVAVPPAGSAMVPRTPRSRAGQPWAARASGAASRCSSAWRPTPQRAVSSSGPASDARARAVDDQREAARSDGGHNRGDFAAVGQGLPRTTLDQADVDHCPGSIGGRQSSRSTGLTATVCTLMAIIDGDQVRTGSRIAAASRLRSLAPTDSRIGVSYSEPTGCPIRGRGGFAVGGSGSSTWGCRSWGTGSRTAGSASPSRCCPS